MKKQKKTKLVSFVTTEELYAWLKQESAKRQLSMGNFIRLIIEQELPKQ